MMICICIYMYMYIRTCHSPGCNIAYTDNIMSRNRCARECTHTHMYTCVHIYIYVYMRICTYIYIYVYMHVYVYVCVYIYIYIYMLPPPPPGLSTNFGGRRGLDQMVRLAGHGAEHGHPGYFFGGNNRNGPLPGLRRIPAD